MNQDSSIIKTSQKKRSADHVDLAYSYIESFLETKSKSIDAVNNRSTVFLGFSGLILRFSLDLHYCEWYLLLSKAGVILMASISAVSTALALSANQAGLGMNPKSLASSKWATKEMPEIKQEIIEKWLQGIESYEESESKKGKYLNCAIATTVAAVILSGLNILLSSWH